MIFLLISYIPEYCSFKRNVKFPVFLMRMKDLGNNPVELQAVVFHFIPEQTHSCTIEEISKHFSSCSLMCHCHRTVAVSLSAHCYAGAWAAFHGAEIWPNFPVLRGERQCFLKTANLCNRNKYCLVCICLSPLHPTANLFKTVVRCQIG